MGGGGGDAVQSGQGGHQVNDAGPVPKVDAVQATTTAATGSTSTGTTRIVAIGQCDGVGVEGQVLEVEKGREGSEGGGGRVQVIAAQVQCAQGAGEGCQCLRGGDVVAGQVQSFDPLVANAAAAVAVAATTPHPHAHE